jgi:murein DD-endopeptidase MepM/ murein hydrolase activator NlpD
MIRLGFRIAILALPVAALAACEAEPRYPIVPGQPMGQGGMTVDQPRYPIQQGQTPSSAPPSGPPPRAAPMSDVETRPLGAPGSTPPSSTYPPPPPPGAAGYPATYSADPDLRGRQTDGLPRLRPAPPPALETPRTVQVQPFESVYDVAERVRTPIRAIIDLNHLRPPYTLTAGTILNIPPPVIYTVKDGDTLFGVARRFSIDPRSLANLNDIPLETRIKSGQRLALPSLVRDKGPNPAARGAKPEGLTEPTETAVAGGSARPGQTPATVPGAAHAYARPTGTAKADSGADRAATEPLPPRPETPAASDSEITALGKGKFAWPVRGAIISTYGPKGAGQRNDGVNIAASTGDSVKAAAAGTVVYAGNSIPAFGNLVLVKHPGGWATLYGNLGKITVKNNAQVTQGEEVGTAGISGAVDKPQVHFEIRYAQNPHDKAKPYDPATLLP